MQSWKFLFKVEAQDDKAGGDCLVQTMMVYNPILILGIFTTYSMSQSNGKLLVHRLLTFCTISVMFSSPPLLQISTHSFCLFVFPDVPWTLLDFKANAVNVDYFQLEGDSLHPYYITQGLGCSKLGLSDTWLWGMSVKMPMKQERDS